MDDTNRAVENSTTYRDTQFFRFTRTKWLRVLLLWLHGHKFLKAVNLKMILALLTFFMEVQFMPEQQINITEKLQKIGQTAQDYKDAIVSQFKDMEVEVKDWNFSVGKLEKEYVVEVNLKLGIRPKKA